MRVISTITMLLVAGVLALAGSVNANSRDVWVLTIDGAIGPAISDYVMRSIDKANQADAHLIVLKMNTPGGLDGSMRNIIEAILESPTPVASYVSPKGARAASAGTYISYASHIAAMAPATNLGAATPVQIAAPSAPSAPDTEKQGQEKDTDNSPPEPTAMEKKMVNDAAAYIRGLAELRDRNVKWAEQAVREAVSLSASEALEQNVVDYIATDVMDLLTQIDGLTVTTEAGDIILATSDASLREASPDWRTELLAIITNPNVVLILGMIGFYGIILEFYNPGSLVPGIVGVICLILAGYALQLLPVNLAGLILLVLGLGLMIAEAMVPSFGIMGIGGVIAFVMGGLMLFDTEVEAFQVGLPILAASAVVLGMLVFATIHIALRVRRQKVSTGVEQIVGEAGKVMSVDADGVQVRIGGEIWAADGPDDLAVGDTVIVTAVHNLRLKVAAPHDDTESPYNNLQQEN